MIFLDVQMRGVNCFMLEYVFAALFPIFLLLLFNRVLFSKFLPLIITILILLIGFDGLHQPLPLQIIAVISTIIGYFLGLKIYKKQKRKVK
jgi:general stress protein CsbA